ncbi:MAG: hypothetical protein ACP5M8_07620 [Caldisphaera sp.]
MVNLSIEMVIETSQRGTYATAKLLYEKLKKRGHNIRLWTTFQSEYNALPEPKKNFLFGNETSINMPRYAKKALRLMDLNDNSIVHAMNAMHELVYLAHKNGSKSVITVQYPWPICYFNSYEYKSVDAHLFIMKYWDTCGIVEKDQENYSLHLSQHIGFISVHGSKETLLILML